MSLIRTILRNFILNFFPAGLSHAINLCKNLSYSYLEPEMKYVGQVLTEMSRARVSMTVVDVGANLGLYTQIALNSGCNVIAIEPQLNLSNYLRRVFATKPVQIYEIALTEKANGLINLRVPFIPFLPSRFASLDQFATVSKDNDLENFKSTKNVVVKTSTLDHICLEQGNIVLIKIDVEGAEMNVLLGGVEILSSLHPILLIEIQSKHGGSFEQVETFLKKFGYVAYFYQNEKLHLCTETAIRDSTNFVFLHVNQ